jgi:hypothetical protein
MTIKPILFNTEMVRAILDGRKSCTRRAVKPQPKAKLCYKYAGSHKSSIGKWGYPSKTAYKYWDERYKLPDNISEEDLEKLWNPPCHTDDILYVRETWQYLYELDGNEQVIEDTGKYYYAATDTIPFDTYVDENGVTHDHTPWRPSIHMPKEAARIWLKVTNVRVERLQDITSEQIYREGTEVEEPFVLNGEEKRYAFSVLWNSTIKKSDLDRYGWDANPYVFVIEFVKIDKPEEIQNA